ncbi:MAG: hypothetical protein Q9221_000470 [Calogaya cf. arnoldii]
MSQYFTSFLIEPVIRQARRFSRQSNDDRPFHPANVHPSSDSDQGAASHQRTPCIHPEATVPESDWQLIPDRLTPQSTQTATEESDTVLRYSGRPPEVDLPAWSDTHHPLGISHEDSLATATGLDIALPNHQFSSSRVHGITESLRSATSSLSDQAQSAIDPNAMDVQLPAQSSIQYPADASTLSVQLRDGSLPADDGMSSKRRQIVAIQNRHTSSDEKARLVHNLMNEGYSSSQPNLQTSHSPYPPSPMSVASHAKLNSATSGHSGNTIVSHTSPPASLSAGAEPNNAINISAEALRPTYYQNPEIHPKTTGPESRSSNRLSQDSTQEEYKVLGCPHYQRNIKLQCAECYRWYTCRFCHDEVETHSLDRPATKNMLCMFCGCAQPASGECTQCGEPSARYYCDVCKFWDNTPWKPIYHCNDCGLCRVGEGLGKDFFHCKVEPPC